MYTYSCASKRYGAAKKGPIDVLVKGQILDLTLLWQTAIKCVPKIATKKIIVPWIATAKSLNLRADCQGVIPVVENHNIRAQFATKE
jgi:hypothetical protein